MTMWYNASATTRSDDQELGVVAMSSKIKLGFIGCGGIVKGHLEHGLASFPDVEFVGWCDTNPEAAEARRAEVGGRGKVYTHAGKMLDESQPDAVYIMLPPFAHGPAEEAVVERGLPFFIEKPVAIDLPTARKVFSGVQRKKLLTSVGYMTRYRNSVQRVKELLKKQKPVLAHGGWLGGGPDKYEGIWKWWVQKDKSGGQFLEQTTHTTDLIRYLFGEVKSVYAVPVTERKKRPSFFTIEDASMVQLAFASGAAANLYSSVSTSVGGGIFLSVWGTDLRADFTGWEHTVRIESPDGEVIQIPGEANIFAKEDRAFIDSVKAGKNKGILATYEDGLRATEIACAASESMKSGKVVNL
ncbi:MAG: scyllo-inositol 2-dehydrogenase (NAD(+)) [bacterium]|nr:scyllo-inositol 2-dehydrogenase (NAD(+)) [bacterium]